MIEILFILGILFSIPKTRNILLGSEGSDVKKHASIVKELCLVAAVLMIAFSVRAFLAQFGEPFPAEWLLLFETAVAGLVAYKYRVYLPAFVAAVSFGMWVTVITEFYIGPAEGEYLMTINGVSALFILYLIGRLFAKYKHKFAGMFTWVSAFIFAFLSLVFSTTDMVGEIGKELVQPLPSSVLVWGISGLVAVGFFGGLYAAFTKKAVSKIEALSLVGLWAVWLVPLFVSSATNVTARGDLTLTGIVLTILFNVAVAGMFVGMIVKGYRKKQSRFINVGTFGVFIFIIIKYFDWLFSFLDKSVFFTIAGLLVLAGGFAMDKSRRALLDHAK